MKPRGVALPLLDKTKMKFEIANMGIVEPLEKLQDGDCEEAQRRSVSMCRPDQTELVHPLPKGECILGQLDERLLYEDDVNPRYW